MRKLPVCLAVFLLCVPALAQEMTYEEAKSHLRPRTLPAWWIGSAEGLGAVGEAGAGQGPRNCQEPRQSPAALDSYGELEPLRQHANFNSAMGGRDPAAYADKATRRKPVVYFVGPVHGHEVEGLTGLANLIAVMETRPRSARQAAAGTLRAGRAVPPADRPCGNPDGTARFEPRAIHGMDSTTSSSGRWARGATIRSPFGPARSGSTRASGRRSAGWAATSTTRASTRCTTSFWRR